MHKKLFTWAAFLGGLSVILGAFGAHALKKMVTPETVSVFETGVRYQFYHALALLALAFSGNLIPAARLRMVFLCFLTGVLLFSGSLYLLTGMQALGSTGFEKWGWITPLGGLFLIAGWFFLFLEAMKGKAQG